MKLSLALVAAAAFCVAAALGAFALPASLVENLVMDSGLPAVLAAAEPPLGFTARALLASGLGLFVGLVAWLGLSVVLAGRSVTIGRFRAEAEPSAAPAIRRADAHPDAPPRPPLLATRDLGTPFLEIRASGREPVATAPEEIVEEPVEPVEQPLPEDLDQPLAAFDPDAMPEVPLAAPVTLPSLSQPAKPAVFEPNERFEVYQLMPPVRPAPAPELVTSREERIMRPETEASVHALLERLERGVARRTAPAQPIAERRARERGIEDTLVTLRNLARRA